QDGRQMWRHPCRISQEGGTLQVVEGGCRQSVAASIADCHLASSASVRAAASGASRWLPPIRVLSPATGEVLAVCESSGRAIWFCNVSAESTEPRPMRG